MDNIHRTATGLSPDRRPFAAAPIRLRPGATVDSVIAKDSFTATAATVAGDVFTGPLFIMEKMPAGFDPDSGDWRYTMIMPDGSLFGTTNGDGSVDVTFCNERHTEQGKRDRMFFVPEELVRRALVVPVN